MGKLEDLKAFTKQAFEKAEKKEDILLLTQIDKTIDEAIAEHESLKKEQKELLKDLKELAINGGVSAKKPEETVPTGSSFEASLEAYLESHSKKG